MKFSSIDELSVSKFDTELELSDDIQIQIKGGIKNPLPGPATIVLMLIQPDEFPVLKSVNVSIPEVEQECQGDNVYHFPKSRATVLPEEITIQLITKYDDGMLSKDILTVAGKSDQKSELC